MRPGRRLMAAAAAALGLSGAVLLAAPARAATIGPLATAWYDASRPDSSVPAAPMPDVAPDQLLINGAAAAGAPAAPPPPVAPPGGPPPAPVGGGDGGSVPTAAAALDFAVPAGQSAVGLVVKSARPLPSGTPAPLACLITAAFPAGAQQPFPTPTHDCSTSSLGVVDGDAVRFPDIGRLQKGGRLAVLLLPGAAGRLVLAAPGADALSLADLSPVPFTLYDTSSGGTGAFGSPGGAPTKRAALPPARVPTRTPPAVASVPPPGAAQVPPAATLPGAALPAAPGAAPVEPVQATALPSLDASAQAAAPPVDAAPPPPSAGGAAPVAAASSAAARRDDTGARVAAGIGLLLVALAALLALGGGRFGGAALVPLLARVSGGRLVAAGDAAGTPRQPRAAGVGRFRSERTGAVPRL